MGWSRREQGALLWRAGTTAKKKGSARVKQRGGRLAASPSATFACFGLPLIAYFLVAFLAGFFVSFLAAFFVAIVYSP